MAELREDNAQEKSVENAEEVSEVEAETEEEQTADQEMMKMQQEVRETNDMMLRLAAELDNYKKRVKRAGIPDQIRGAGDSAGITSGTG